MMSFCGLHIGDSSYTHVHALHAQICSHPHTGGELQVGWKSVYLGTAALCLGTRALCRIVLCVSRHEVVNGSLKGGGVREKG